ITGRRLNIDLFKRSLVEKSGIRHAVQGHASRQTEPFQACLAMKLPGHLQKNLFGNKLDTGGDIGVMLVFTAELLEIDGPVAKIGRVAGRGSEEMGVAGGAGAE